MQLHELKPKAGSRPGKQIVGRGEGSGWGQTAGKGQKGQSSRAGDTIMLGFEGGQTPLHRRIPKRGFRHASKINYEPINLIVLEERFAAGDQVDGASLYKKGVIKSAELPFKILGIGKLTKSLTVQADRFSKSAEQAIEAAGGKSSLTVGKKAFVKNSVKTK
jgi:large subunit ribosomal protein L15